MSPKAKNHEDEIEYIGNGFLVLIKLTKDGGKSGGVEDNFILLAHCINRWANENPNKRIISHQIHQTPAVGNHRPSVNCMTIIWEYKTLSPQ